MSHDHNIISCDLHFIELWVFLRAPLAPFFHQWPSLLLACITKELQGYIKCLEKHKMCDGIRHILTISRLGNGHIQYHKPWELVKGTPEDKLVILCIVYLAIYWSIDTELKLAVYLVYVLTFFVLFLYYYNHTCQ